MLTLLSGCAHTSQTTREIPSSPVEELEHRTIAEYILYPGDEIKITVLGYDELTRDISIPPNGAIVYPLLGEIDVTGQSLKTLRQTIVGGLADYQRPTLLPGDEISITVYRHDDLDRRVVIPPDGYVFVPLAGEFQLRGLTPKEARTAITTALDKFLVEPQVDVTVVTTNKPQSVAEPDVAIEITKFAGQKIFVLGEVKIPGVFVADGHKGVVEAIVEAGGFTPDARTGAVLLIRQSSESDEPLVAQLDLAGLLKRGEGGASISGIVLERGDIVYVPRTRIADVARFAKYLSTILSPVVELERGIFLGQQIDEGANNQNNIATTGAVGVGQGSGGVKREDISP